MKKIKRVTALFLSAAMSVSLSACGGNQPAATEPAATTTPAADSGAGQPAAGTESPAAASGENVTLTMSWWGGDARHEATQQALAALNQKYPNIKVEGVFGGWQDWESKMGLAFSQGNAEDIVQMGSFWHIMYNQDGQTFVNLYDYRDYIDLTQFDNLEAYEVDGKLYCLPASMTARTMFWNKSVFAAAGIEIPVTWDELIAAGGTFKEKLGDEYYPLTMTNLDRMLFMVWYLESQYGKEWVSGKECNYTIEEITTGFEMIKMLEDSHVMPTMQEIVDNAADPIERSPVWTDQKWAGVYTWNTSPKNLQATLPDPDDLVPGAMFEGFPHTGGMYKAASTYGITSSCKYPVEAAMALNYLVNDPEGAGIMGTQRGIPVSKSAIAAAEAAGTVDPLIKEATDIALAGAGFPMDEYFESNDYKATTEGLYDRTFNAFSYGEVDAAGAAKMLLDGMNETMAKN